MAVTAYCRPEITGFIVRPVRVSECGSSCPSDGTVMPLTTTASASALSGVGMSYLMEGGGTICERITPRQGAWSRPGRGPVALPSNAPCREDVRPRLDTPAPRVV